MTVARAMGAMVRMGCARAETTKAAPVVLVAVTSITGPVIRTVAMVSISLFLDLGFVQRHIKAVRA